MVLHRILAATGTLRVRLIFLVVVALIPAFGLLVYTGLEQRNSDESSARAQALRLTQVVATQQDVLTQNSKGVLSTLASLTAGANLTSVDASKCAPVISSILTQFPSVQNLGLVNAKGDFVCDATGNAVTANFASKSFFTRAVASGKFAIGDYELDGAGRAVLNAGYPAYDASGNLDAVYFASMDLNWLAPLASEVGLPKDAVILVVDARGTVIAGYPDARGHLGQNIRGDRLGATILAKQEGTSQLPGLDGTDRLYSFAPLTSEGQSPAYVAIGLSASHAFAAADRTLARNIGLLGVVTALAIVAAWLAGGLFVTRPVDALSRTARRLAAGDLGARTGARDGAAELSDLAGAFDEMAQALETKEFERRKTASDLEANLSELARSNAELEAFTYSVSHDLKEPLRTIEAFSQFLLEDYQVNLDDQGRDYLQKLASASARMKHLIEDLLALSRIGRRDVATSTVDVGRIIAGVVEGMRATIDERGAELRVEPDLPGVRADVARIQQIFGNLIANGIKFNRSEHPSIEIGVRAQGGDTATFFVRDNGIGIEPAYHERIFGIFQRLHRREEFDGTGAGLAIVKRAVESLGGTVEVESDGAAGTTFVVTLPTTESRQADERAAA
jgi:signal transduction histidine kinase